MDLPLGENRAPISVPFAFTFDWILARGDQRSSILVLAYNPSLASTIKRLPADDGNGSYLSSGVVDRRSKILDDPPPGCALAHPPDVILSMPADSIRAEIQPAVGSGARKPLSPIRIHRIRNANGCLPLTRRGRDVLPHEADQSSAPRASVLMAGHAGELRVDHHPCLRCAIWRIEQRDVGLRSIDAILQHRLVSPGRIGS